MKYIKLDQKWITHPLTQDTLNISRQDKALKGINQGDFYTQMDEEHSLYQQDYTH